MAKDRIVKFCAWSGPEVPVWWWQTVP